MRYSEKGESQVTTTVLLEKIKRGLMKQAYLIEIDNLGFRPCVEGDLDYLMILDADPETMSFFPGGVRSREEIQNNIRKYITSYHEKGYSTFVIFDTKTGEFIGRAGFGDIETGETEVGYLVLKKYWGKGYASRILKILLAWAKNNIKKDKIIAYTPLDHTASERVMQKAGMHFSRKGIMKGVECVIYEFKF
jgi:RimJ/RimL family protein N-acetyltransferase